MAKKGVPISDDLYRRGLGVLADLCRDGGAEIFEGDIQRKLGVSFSVATAIIDRMVAEGQVKEESDG